VIGGHGAGHEVAEGVPEHGRRAVAELADDLGDVIGKLAQADVGHGSSGSRDAPGLRAQDPVAGAD